MVTETDNVVTRRGFTIRCSTSESNIFAHRLLLHWSGFYNFQPYWYGTCGYGFSLVTVPKKQLTFQGPKPLRHLQIQHKLLTRMHVKQIHI